MLSVTPGQSEIDPTSYVYNTITPTSSLAPSATISGGELPTSTALPVLAHTSSDAG
jgi:hypothetical protein